MFDDKNVKNEGFKSHWKSKRSTNDVGTETNFSATFREGSSQTVGSHEKQVQVSQETFTPNQAVYKEENLTDFMRKACKIVLDALAEEDPTLKCLSEPIIEEADVNFQRLCAFKGNNSVLVSSIAWSCDEKIIAVGYRHHHENWCRHSGIIDLLKYDESSCQEFSTKQSFQTLNLKNCVSCVSFHPKECFVLAAGTVSGDVYLWTIKSRVTKSEIFSTHHSDCITQISWTPNPTNSKLMLASSSKDSVIILWDLSVQSSFIKPMHRFLFENESHPKVEPGVNCFAFAPMQDDTFVTSLMNGSLLKCSIVASRPLPQVKGRKFTAQNAVVGAFKNCSSSPIISIDFQPSKQSLFVAVSADQKCFVFSLTSMEPLRIIISDQNIISAKWYQPDLQYFITWGENIVTFYNTDLESFQLNFEPFKYEVDKTTLTTVCFNPDVSKHVAYGSTNGKVVVWKMPTKINKSDANIS